MCCEKSRICETNTNTKHITTLRNKNNKKTKFPEPTSPTSPPPNECLGGWGGRGWLWKPGDFGYLCCFQLFSGLCLTHLGFTCFP